MRRLGSCSVWTRLVPAALLTLPTLAGHTAPAPAAHSSSAHSPALAWVFDIHDDAQLVPHGRVYLSVDGRRCLVEGKAGCRFTVLSPDEYHAHGVPAGAVSACTGWFAGGGEDLYAVRRGSRLLVFRRWSDEQAPEFPWRRLRAFPWPGTRQGGT